jgi:hypothetical protein
MTELKRFQATAVYGTAYTVIKRKHVLPRSRAPGMRGVVDYVLVDGRSVRPEGDDMYEIVDNGELIRRVR